MELIREERAINAYKEYLKIIHKALDEVGRYAYSHKCEGLTYDDCEKLVEYTDKAINGIENAIRKEEKE